MTAPGRRDRPDDLDESAPIRRRELLGSLRGDQFRADPVEKQPTRRCVLAGVGGIGAALLGGEPVAAAADLAVQEPSSGSPARPLQMDDPAFPEGEVTLRLDPVVGTCREFWRAFETEGVTDQDGGTIGVTDALLSINGQSAGSFQIGPDHYDVTAEPSEDEPNFLVASNFDVQFSIENHVDILDWRPCERPSDECLAAWRDRFRQTLWHERQHVRFFLAAVERANQEWANKTVRVNVAGTSTNQGRRTLRERVRKELSATINRDIFPRENSGSPHDELHQNQEPIEGFCDRCEPCRARGDAIEAVETYQLQTDYRFSGRVDMEDGEWVVDQTARGMFTLHRRERDGLLAGAAGVLGGVSEALAGLTGSQDTTVRDNGLPLVWSGIGSVTGTWREWLVTEDGTFRSRHQVESAYDREGDEAYPAELRVLRRDDEWTVSWPMTVAEYEDQPGGSVVGMPRQFATGMAAQTGDYDPASDPFDLPERATYPVPECSVTLVTRIQNDLEGWGPFRMSVGQFFPGDADGGTGREFLRISLTPGEMRDCGTPESYVEVPETLSDPVPLD